MGTYNTNLQQTARTAHINGQKAATYFQMMIVNENYFVVQ